MNLFPCQQSENEHSVANGDEHFMLSITEENIIICVCMKVDEQMGNEQVSNLIIKNCGIKVKASRLPR